MKTIRPDPATSERMGRVRKRGTKIETMVAAVLREMGHHYRKNVVSLPGSPDFANRKHRWALFVNGCFWHHHTGCKQATVPKTNADFWIAKFRDNRRRDARAILKLRRQGYRVAIVWGCETDRLRLRLSQIFEASRVDDR